MHIPFKRYVPAWINSNLPTQFDDSSDITIIPKRPWARNPFTLITGSQNNVIKRCAVAPYLNLVRISVITDEAGEAAQCCSYAYCGFFIADTLREQVVLTAAGPLFLQEIAVMDRWRTILLVL